MIIIKIYIDFDGTIFNSTKLYLEFLNIFKKYNIDKEYIENIMNKNYKKYKNFDTIAKIIIKENNLNNSILDELNNIYTKDLIFKDTIPFLEKYSKKYDLILLTLGSNSYQEKKIKSSNINKYFKEIIITNKDKSKLNIDYQNGIFIDNNPLELKKFYNSKAKYLIRIKRKSDKYSKLNLDINAIPEFNNFTELLNSNYIDKIGENNYE